MARKATLLTAALLIPACATAKPVEPASVQAHEQAAQTNEKLAEDHRHAALTAEPCADIPGIYEVCWTRSGTESDHLDSAERHRAIAQAHSAAAEALRAAEEAACSRVTQSDRDTSPFLHTADIAGVESLDAGQAEGESEIPVARVDFRPVAGLNLASMQQLVDCHLARNAALGHDVPEMDFCPLVPAGVRASVTIVDARAHVTLFADERSIEDVRRRVALLASKLE